MPNSRVGIGLAVIGEPPVIGAAHRSRQHRIMHRAGEQPHARVQKGGVDAVQIHIRDALMRVEAAGAPVLVAHRLGRDYALPRADPADPAHALPAAEDLLLDQQPLLTVLVDHELGRPVAKSRVDVVVPQGERLQDMAVRIDDVVYATHDLLLAQW
jgi:hypothetical protein